MRVDCPASRRTPERPSPAGLVGVTYAGSNQHVLGLGSAIGKICLREDPATRAKTLTWNAIGLIRDNDGKEGYTWSYNFTVLAWNDLNLDAAVDQGAVDANGQYCAQGRFVSENLYFAANYDANKTTTALSSFFSYIRNAAFSGTRACTAPGSLDTRES
jgi:hypothetical protein